ncbi:MAG: hypothetical protein AABX72_03095 [Nanoarchaeota archaeon]
MTDPYEQIKANLIDHINKVTPKPDENGIISRETYSVYIKGVNDTSESHIPAAEALCSLLTLRANMLRAYYGLTTEQRTETLGLFEHIDRYTRDRANFNLVRLDRNIS